MKTKLILPIRPGINCLTISPPLGHEGYKLEDGIALAADKLHLEGLPKYKLDPHKPADIGVGDRIYRASMPSSGSDGSGTLGTPDPHNPGWLQVRVHVQPRLEQYHTLTPDSVYRKQGDRIAGRPLDDLLEWFAVDLSVDPLDPEEQNRHLVIAPIGTLAGVLGKYREPMLHLQMVLGATKCARCHGGLATEAAALLRLIGQLDIELRNLATE